MRPYQEGWEGDWVSVDGTVCSEPAPGFLCTLGCSWGSHTSAPPSPGPISNHIVGTDVTPPAYVVNLAY